MNKPDTSSRLAALEAIVPRIEETIGKSIDNLSTKIDSFTKELKTERKDESSRMYIRMAELENKIVVNGQLQNNEYDRLKKELGLAFTISKYPLISSGVIFMFSFLVAFFGRAVWDFVHIFI